MSRERADARAARDAAMLQQEFAALAQRTPDVVGFAVQNPADPKTPLQQEPPDSVALRAIGDSFVNKLIPVPANDRNRGRYKKGELFRGSQRELYEAPKPIRFVPSSSYWIYCYGETDCYLRFASTAEEASRLTGRRPLMAWTWHQFLFDWALEDGLVRWTTLGPYTFTRALNLPRASVQAIADLINELGGTDQCGSAVDAKLPAARGWERLVLHPSSTGCDHSADLDGEPIRIRGDAAFTMLDILQKKKGERVKADDLRIEINKRPDQVLRLLDKRLQRIIDQPHKGSVGYAML